MDRDWKNAKNILCIRLDNMGDVIMTSPAIRALKNATPGRVITLLTSSAGASIAQYIPEVDGVIQFDPPWMPHSSSSKDAAYLLHFAEELSHHQFDAAIIFTVFSQSALPAAMLAYMAGIPLRLAYCRENPYQLLTDWVPDREPFEGIQHEVKRQLDLVDAIDVGITSDELSLRVPEVTTEVESLLQKNGVDLNRPWLIIHPGVSELKRQYPQELFIKAAQLIKKELGYQVLLTGSKNERILTDSMQLQIGENSYSLAGQFDLGQCICLISRAPLIITNNTGPAHIAAAVKTPVVDLYAQTNPQHTPWKVHSKILYFDVPTHLQSRNVLLHYNYPEKAYAIPTPEIILEVAKELLPKQEGFF